MTDIKTAALGGVSLDALNARAASDEAFEFEYVLADGRNSGIFLSVLGAHSERVTSESNKLINERRRAEAVREAEASRAADSVNLVEDDIAFGQRLAAVRLVGWRGIIEDCTPDRALRLCQTNPDIAGQVTRRSNNMGNFMPALSPTS